PLLGAAVLAERLVELVLRDDALGDEQLAEPRAIHALAAGRRADGPTAARRLEPRRARRGHGGGESDGRARRGNERRGRDDRRCTGRGRRGPDGGRGGRGRRGVRRRASRRIAPRPWLASRANSRTMPTVVRSSKIASRIESSSMVLTCRLSLAPSWNSTENSLSPSSRARAAVELKAPAARAAMETVSSV